MDTIKNRRRYWIVGFAAVVTVGFGGASAATAEVTVSARTQGEAAIADWAQAQFAAAGLELPTLEIVFHSDPSGCHDNSGLYRPFHVDLCVEEEFDAYARRALVHELGHAWVAANLTAEDRARFMKARGLSSWNSRDVAWGMRGFEQAAEVITWGVGARDTRILLPDHDEPDSLAAAYETLTGGRAPE